jgi:beta-glucanase (GH16 family)
MKPFDAHPRGARAARAAHAAVATTLTMLLCAAGAACAQGAETAAPSAVPAGYRLVWADEFSVDGLPDPGKWVHDTGRNKDGWHNREQQYYSGPRLDNARVQGGQLVITARKEDLSGAADWGGQHYTAARLLTRGQAEWTYGFFEVRARMPCGKGTWPAIWMLGTGGRWPDDGELDIMEHQGHRPTRLSSAVHMAAGHGGHAVGGATQIADACGAFHNYQMHWTPDQLSFSIDGMVHFHYPNMKLGASSWPFDKPQYMILNIAIGGDLGGPVDDAIFPLHMEVDYVRVYQATR